MPLLHFSFATELAVMKPFMLLIFFVLPHVLPSWALALGLVGELLFHIYYLLTSSVLLAHFLPSSI